MGARAYNPAVSNPEQGRFLLFSTSLQNSPPDENGTVHGDVTRAPMGAPVEILKTGKHRLLIKSEIYGRPLWGWTDDSNVATRKKYRSTHGEDPEVAYRTTNPSYGADLDLETSMAPAWMYYESKEARDQAARVWEGQGKKIIKEHSFFGYRQAGGKKWRLRAADHRGNPGNKLPIYSVSITQAKEIPSVTHGFVALKNARKEAAKVGSQFIAQVKDSSLKHVVYMIPTPSFTLQDLDSLVRRGGGFRAHENPSKAFGGSVHEQLIHAATQYDMKEEATAAKRRAAGKQGYHNIYALPQYLNRISEVEKDIASGTPVRKAITDGFTGRLLDAMLKAVGEGRSTKEEQRGGAWTYKGNPGSFYQRTMHDNAYHEIGETVTSSVYGPVQITARRETNDPEKYKYEYDITPVTSTGRTRRSQRPYGPGPGKRYRGNPEGASEEMFESFHGEPSNETVEYTEEQHYHSNVAALGEMVELKVKLVNGDKAVIGFDAGSGEEQGNPFWPFNSFTKTTIYHVGTGEKYKKSGTFKGYVLYQKLDTGEFLVPALDKDSRFDTGKDAKAFINSWTKHQKNPLPASGVIGANRKSLIEKIFAGGHDAKVYSLQNNFTGEPVSMDWVRKEYGTGYKVRLRYAGAGNYSLRIHSNLTYDFKSEVDPSGTKNPSVDPGFFPSGKLTFKGVEYTIERLIKTPESGNYAYLVRRPGDDEKYVAWVYHYGDQYRGKVFDVTNYRYFDDFMSNPGKHHGPFREAGKLVSGITRGTQRPVDQFLGAVGKVGGYLDDQLGRTLNPDPWDRERIPVSVPGPVNELVQLMNENNAQSRHTPYSGYEITESRKKYHLLNSILTNGQRSAVFMIDKDSLTVYKADGYGKRGRIVGSIQSVIDDYRNARRGTHGPVERNPSNHSDTGPTLLCSNEKGDQLSFVGGDQSLDLNALGITGAMADKELIPIGDVTHITYHTQKTFGKKPEEYDYIHKFSEDSHGPLPVLNYDRINKKLYLSGGVYKIEKPLLGTSPGIED